MSQQNINADRERETAEARAEMLRLAEAQGVRPLIFDELLGEPELRQTQEEIRREGLFGIAPRNPRWAGRPAIALIFLARVYLSCLM